MKKRGLGERSLADLGRICDRNADALAGFRESLRGVAGHCCPDIKASISFSGISAGKLPAQYPRPNERANTEIGGSVHLMIDAARSLRGVKWLAK